MCTFCGWEADSLLVESGGAGAILVDRAPLCLGHLLLVTPRHVASLADLGEAERHAFLSRVEETRLLATAIAGRPTIAVEHGRSPTCGDASCSCHAHVHLVPAGTGEGIELLAKELLTPAPSQEAPYLGLSVTAGKWARHGLARPVPHAARTLAALVAESNGIDWRPLGAPSSKLAARTLEAARRIQTLRGKRRQEMQRRRRPPRPLITVSGSTGSGKSTVGAHLAALHGVPAVELGVILRLLCLDEVARREAWPGSRIWSWARSGRLDFDAASRRGLAAALPRLDGRSEELDMWRSVDPERLATVARDSEVQEVLAALAGALGGRSGGVIVGRVAESPRAPALCTSTRPPRPGWRASAASSHRSSCRAQGTTGLTRTRVR